MKSEPDVKEPPSRGQQLGCFAMVTILLLGLLLVAISVWRLNATVIQFEEQFSGDDWTRIEGPDIHEQEVVTTPTLFFGGDITLHGATADIAILGGDAKLQGTYTKNVHFLGRHLDVAENARIDGNLIITAGKHVTIRGHVSGAIEGQWDRLFSATSSP